MICFIVDFYLSAGCDLLSTLEKRPYTIANTNRSSLSQKLQLNWTCYKKNAPRSLFIPPKAMVECPLAVSVTSWFTPFCPGQNTLSIQLPLFRNTSAPKDIHRPGWSAWTKSKQITFPAVTDLQLSPTGMPARGRQQHGTAGINHHYRFFLTSESVRRWWEHCHFKCGTEREKKIRQIFFSFRNWWGKSAVLVILLLSW